MTKTHLLAAMPLAGALVATAISAAPAASADCASFFGLGNTANCQSGPTSIAIAVGPNATATAAGWFGAALAVGRVPLIGTDNLGVATATTSGAFTFAWAWGDNVTAQAGDLVGIATQWGTNGTTITKGAFNIAQAITNPFPFLLPPTSEIGMTLANGVGNVVTNGAFVTEPGKSVSAVGFGNFAFNGWGFNNVVKSGGSQTSFFNSAIDAFTSGDVTAGPGPFAIAIAFGQAPGESTTQVGPGIKLGVGTGLPNLPQPVAASARPNKKAAPKPAASRSADSGKKSSVASGARQRHKKSD
ncbi:hypothetical protein FHT40_002668 [Mycolicibacterium sp. BK556]|uniref:hypothetical protein n=1 Tax=Mycobacteriaceae TaxID=1762 RepID=UPI00105B97E8|nr:MULTISPECIES: hypothetical protein [Mycobacteriaceae]MBB3603007.1 hypothetical protein [Mycolicibacterium sp. BK556]MBB3633202.1 hypothetical protein [Mycolicibacterium sp. BK607]MBB3750752.1 hypothetical protein [Mycolicibacterium sp. BK634]TDO07176.1 hypothetical protein EV580_6139 [Mycobacterium sp. BK086]